MKPHQIPTTKPLRVASWIAFHRKPTSQNSETKTLRRFICRCLPLRPHPPRWGRRFFRGAIDRMLFQHAHCFRHGALELRIAAGNHFFGPVLDIDVRRHAFVLNRPSILAREEAPAWSDHRPTIDEQAPVAGLDHPPPTPLPPNTPILPYS